MAKNFILVVLVLVSSVGLAAPQFPKEEIKLGNKLIRIEVARTRDQLSHGLMYRESLKPDEGMLFIFPDQDVRSFWMKNTFIALSIGFFDQDRILVDIQDMRPVSSEAEKSPPSYMSAKPAQYALEMNQGWFKRNKIKTGMRFDFVKPSKAK